MLCVLVNTGFQVLFHSPPGVLFTFPSQYCSTIGHQVVFRLGGWSPLLPIGFLVSDGTLDTAKLSPRFTYKTLTSFGWLSHAIRLHFDILRRGPKPLRYFYLRFGLFRFRSPLLAKSRWFLFLPVLRCFSSRGSPRNTMYSCYVSWFFTMSVSTFGYLRIYAYLQLPAAFRSLSRPSSAPDAKAFTLCSYSLELSYQWSLDHLVLFVLLELLEFHKNIF